MVLWYEGAFWRGPHAKVIHSVVATAANVHDSSMLGDLLHDQQRDVWGDQAYQDQSEVIRKRPPRCGTVPTGCSQPAG